MKILVIPGSLRQGSLNADLAGRIARRIEQRRGMASLAGQEDLSMPIYDGDIEKAYGLPPAALRLKQRLHHHDALVFVSPEYNASIPPLLKNAIDWTSRPDDGPYGRLEPYAGKPAALFSASPGRLGGRRALDHLRGVLENCGARVVPEQFSLGDATAFLAGDRELPAREQAGIGRVLDGLLEILTESRRVSAGLV